MAEYMEADDRLPEKIKDIMNELNGGLAAKYGIWCPKCGDALAINVINGALAIGCFGCGDYIPISKLVKPCDSCGAKMDETEGE